MHKYLLTAALTAAVVAACGDTPGKIIGIDDAVVTGVAYVDRDGDGVRSPADGVAGGVNAALLLEATGDTVAKATTRSDGSFTMTKVPVGRYRLVAARGALPDTLDVIQVEDATITLAVGDTATRLIRVGFSSTPISTVRTLEDGRQVVLQGLALNGWPAFGDSTVHVMDATGSMRAVRVTGPNTIATGDSIRLVGLVGMRGGQKVVTGATGTIIRKGAGVPEPDSIATGTAASAQGGSRDAGQVRVAGLIIGAQDLPQNEFMLTIDDGSGRLEVVLDASIPFNVSSYVPGATLTASGVLVPATIGKWQLKPRAAADARATYPTVTVAEARSLPVGRTVYVIGVALSGWATFGDQTVHVRDATGAIRGVQMPSANIFVGDSIRILGTTAVRDGQPVLRGTSSAVLLAGVGAGIPDSVSTQAAATAQGGSRDAGQVAVSGTVNAVAVDGSDSLLTVSDGTGDLVVRLDRDVGFITGAYKQGDVVRVRGVLVPSTSSPKWELKPRAMTEIAITGGS
jgi:hypothetical protein